MAHSLSARKRVRQNEKRKALNRWRKRRVRLDIKSFLQAVQGGDQQQATDAYQTATRSLDRIASKGTIHKNTAARRKSRLARRLNEMRNT